MEVFNVDGIKSTIETMISYRKFNSAIEKVINYRVRTVITDVKLAS